MMSKWDSLTFSTYNLWTYSPLHDEARELINFDDELLEDPTITSLCGVDSTAQILEESSQMEEEDSNLDTLITMWYVAMIY